MAISDVSVNIMLEKVVQRLDFGIPLIMTAVLPTDEGVQTHQYAEYSNVSEVEKIFGNDNDITKIARLVFAQENAPERVACCSTTDSNLDALKSVVDQNWRQLILTSLDWEGEVSSLSDVFDWCEENKRMLFTSTNDLEKLSGLSAKQGGYNHVCVLYYQDDTGQVKYPEAALVGATAGKKVGSFTYKNQILANVLPMVMDSPRLELVHEAGYITILAKAGDIVTSEGKAISGQYIDITDSRDWLEQQITYKVQKLLNYNDKIPYDDNGINLIDSTVVSVLKEAYNNGMIADDEEGLPSYWTKCLLRHETEKADRFARSYIGCSFGFDLAGAVHTVRATGYIEF